MRLLLAGPITASIIAFWATSANAADCTPSAHAVDDAWAALRNAYAAAQSLDEAGWHNSITPDFYAYDGGHRFDGNGMFAIVKSARAAGKTYQWTISEPDAHATCGWVWVAYVNHGSVTSSAGTKQLTWLESAVLRDDAGKWKIAFLHSTRVPAN